jgi:hypothetical protein
VQRPPAAQRQQRQQAGACQREWEWERAAGAWGWVGCSGCPLEERGVLQQWGWYRTGACRPPPAAAATAAAAAGQQQRRHSREWGRWQQWQRQRRRHCAGAVQGFGQRRAQQGGGRGGCGLEGGGWGCGKGPRAWGCGGGEGEQIGEEGRRKVRGAVGAAWVHTWYTTAALFRVIVALHPLPNVLRDRLVLWPWAPVAGIHMVLACHPSPYGRLCFFLPHTGLRHRPDARPHPPQPRPFCCWSSPRAPPCCGSNTRHTSHRPCSSHPTGWRGQCSGSSGCSWV